MKVYFVVEHRSNGETYEDCMSRDQVIEAFATKEKADEFVKTYIPEGVTPELNEEVVEARAKKEWEKATEEDRKRYGSIEKIKKYIPYNIRYMKESQYINGVRYITVNGLWTNEFYRTRVVEKEVKE